MTQVPFPRDAYYERIGATDTLLPLVTANTDPTPGALGVNFLRNLMIAHLSTIPFENVDALIGRPISMHLCDIYDKLVHAKRGGYCFEQNSLLRAAVIDAGFTHIRTLAARTAISDEHAPVGRGHIMNMVTIHTATGPARWLVDVGTSAGVPMAPLSLETSESQFTPAGEFRVRGYDFFENKEMVRYARPAGGFDEDWYEYVFEMHAHSGTWRAIHRFDLQPQLPRDVYVLNDVAARHSVVGYSLRGSLAASQWAAEGTQGIPHCVGEFVCVPRGVYSLFVDTATRASARALTAFPDGGDSREATGDLAPLMPAEFDVGAVDLLMAWMTEHLGVVFNHPDYPQHSVNAQEFVDAMKRRVLAYGGECWNAPRY